MDNGMSLREQLAKESPDLYAVLMRCWKTGEEVWLPAVHGNNGSFNSYPHLRNIEHHADEILAQVSGADAPFGTVRLSPPEKFLLLAAILFHDLGRGQSNDTRPHGEITRDLLRANWAELGIGSKRMAEALGDICCYHECGKEALEELDLHAVDIAPHGTIHVKRLAVLLAFFDELDGSFRRIYPDYLTTGSIVEAFRRGTSDIRTDVRTMTVITCVDIERNSLGGKVKVDGGFEVAVDYAAWEEKKEGRLFRWQEFAPKSDGKTSGQVGLLQKHLSNIWAFCAEEHKENTDKEHETGRILPRVPESPWADECLPYRILLGLLRTSLPKTLSPEHGVELNDSRLRLVALASSVRGSAEKLDAHKQFLARYGVPFRAWVLELDEHLFTWYGCETYEAALSKTFLAELADRMWQLASGVFGSAMFSYETLAAKVRERSVWRIRLGVRRLAIITRHRQSQGRPGTHSPIRFHEAGWYWEDVDGTGQNDPSLSKHCLKWVLERIDGLADPQQNILKTEMEGKANGSM